jgi:septal ring factor EnvC (AmiA/AmiB activator)
LKPGEILQMRAVVLSLLSTLVITAACASAQEQMALKPNQALEDARSDIEALLTNQADLYDQLAEIESRLEESSQAQRRCRRQISRLNSEIGDLQSKLQAVRDSLLQKDSLFAAHLIRLYQELRLEQAPPPLLDPGSQQRFRRRLLLSRLVTADRQYLESLYLQESDYRDLLRSLVDKQGELEALRSSKRAEEREYQESLARREQLLAALKREQRRKMMQLRSLAQSPDIMGHIVTQLEAGEDSSLVVRERDLVSKMKGRLRWPVQGELLNRFGVSRDPITNLTSKCSGVKIAVAPGTKVVAALTGEVVYIGWARGLESFVVVDHGGRVYSLYGNLDQIEVEETDQVIRGEPFATAAGDQLHFEIRQGKQAVDPLGWLKQ